MSQAEEILGGEVESLDGFLTTAMVARRFNVSTRAVLHMIEKGRLPSVRLGYIRVVNELDLPESWPPPK